MVRASAARFAQEQINEAIRKSYRPDRAPNYSLLPPGAPHGAPGADRVDHSMQIMMEESFAPVVGIMPVKDDAEAIRLMNDSRYGITAFRLVRQRG